MTPSTINRALQTMIEKHNAAPTPHRKRRVLSTSPLVPCPEIGVVFNGNHKKSSQFSPPFQFRPLEHAAYERRLEEIENQRMSRILEDLDQINEILPLDDLIQALQEQADRAEKLPMPIPLRVKLHPQIRRLKRGGRRHSKKHKLQKKSANGPKSGRLIPRVCKPRVHSELMPEHPPPKILTLLLITRLLDLPAEMAMNSTAGEIIAHRRPILYREEGAKWVHLFIPGVPEDDPRIPRAFRMFDNTDEGIPEEIIANRNLETAQEVYQLRVIAKRFLMSQEIDFEERFLLGEVIGMSEAEVNFAFLKLHLEQAISGKSEADLRNLVFSTYREAFNANQVEGEGFEDMVKNYEDLVVPMLDDLFAE
ncbi:hypothetical protein GCK72_017131 [Caenorhabditis remanei]|uniref:Uncharacterized protein n=1 Tax=Caenorhabditis remanei TaxID=31234 RepID=A0A6A5G6F1_CAERE|nr:hypothetical protein GCK72_017131 [Caenorhabditis remanei]KAF1750580.1 hypothetical protein GCK72_017131 [Caenorhabditis remanei]